MSFQWSKNANHIQSLYRNWEIADGWNESTVMAAERLLQLKFPTILRKFYLSWGKRGDYTNSRERLLEPKDNFIRSDHLIFCVENQAILYWSIPLESITLDDPPVYFTYNEDTESDWKPSHKQVSHFLDALMYAHAFAKGAVHGGFARMTQNAKNAIMIMLKQDYQELQLDSFTWGLIPTLDLPQWTLFIKPGIAVDFSGGELWVASQTERIILDLEKRLNLNWEMVW
jgi:hypothetical protein